jgi:hypothetical protein
MDKYELPYLYWIPELDKNPYKKRYIAGSANAPRSLYLYGG